MKKFTLVLFTLLTMLPQGLLAAEEIREKVIYLLNEENHTATVSGCQDAATISTILIKDTLLVGEDKIKYTVKGIEPGALDACTKTGTLNIQSNDWNILTNIDITKMRPTLRIGLGGLWYYHKGKTWGASGEYFSVGDGGNSGHQNIPASLLLSEIKDKIKNINVTKITGNINLDIKNLTIPASIEEITGNALAENRLLSFTVKTGNPNYKSVDGVLFDKSGKTLVGYPAGKTSTTYNVPNDVETIGMCAFGKSTNLRTINLSNTVTTIEESAFNRLTNLSTFNTGNVKTIGKTAFANSGLTSITFGSALTTIGTMAFQNCKNLTGITIPNNIETIEAQAFYGCIDLESVTFNKPINVKLQEIPANTFANCDMLTTITIPDGIVTIGNGAFNPSGLHKVFLPTSASNVHANAFADDVTIHRQLDLTFEGNDQWTTYYSRENLTLPSGLEAFVVTGINGNNLNTTKIEFIPKEIPILIQRTGDQTSNFQATSKNQKLPDGVSPCNEFQGTLKEKNIASLSGDKYVLKGDQFIKTHTGSLPAFRCYLQIDNGNDIPSSFYINTKDPNPDNTIIKQEGGSLNNNAGTVDLTRDGQVMKLTIKPIDALYIDKDHITVKRSISASSARAPGMNQNTINVTFVSEDANRTQTYTFPYTADWNYEVTVNFQKRINLLDASNKPKVNLTIPEGGYTYDGAKKEPAVASVTYEKDGKTKTIAPNFYKIEYEANTFAGTAKVIVTGKGHFMGSTTQTFNIARRNINIDNVEYAPNPISSQTYTREEIKPELTITDMVGGKNIISPDDYELVYSNNINAGTAKIAIKAKETNYTGAKNLTFTIEPKALSDDALEDIPSQSYTGSEIKPTLVIKDGGFTVTEDNYEVKFSNNKEVGQATVTVTFKNNYKGTATKTFQIKDAEIERTLNLEFNGTEQWATYFSSENLNIEGQGLNVFVIAGLDSNNKTVVTQKVNFIPKNVGVLLQRTGTKTKEFKGITMPTSTNLPSGITPDTKLFQGTVEGINDLSKFSGNKFVLIGDQFVQATEGMLAGNRCYLNTGSTAIDGVISLISGKKGNDIILQEEGSENNNAGIVTVSDPKDGKVTITVTPIDVLYATAENITVVRNVNAGSARAPQFDDSKVKVTAVDATADPSGTTQYTFPYTEGYNYQIIVNFQKLKDFTKQSSKASITVKYAERVYNGSPYEPKGDDVTVKWDGKELKAGEDYDISYADNINAGKGKVVITGKRYYMNTKEATFDIAQRDIKLATVKDITDQTYTGSGIEPKLAITDMVNDKNIITEDDYTLEFTNNQNVGKAKVAIIGNKTNYKNIKDVYFNIIPKDLTKTVFIQPIEDQAYTGSAITPALTIKDGELTLEKETDYNVEYSNNIDAGEIANVDITFIGNYKGSAQTTFNIKEGTVERTLNLAFDEGAYWATFYSADNLTIPDGLKAYVVTGLNGNDIKTTEVDFIPKETAILLQRTTQMAPFNSTLLPTSKKLEGVTPDKALFQGTIEGINDLGALSGNKFVFAGDKFVQTAEGQLPANRCYLNTGDATIEGVITLNSRKEPNDIIKLEEGKENISAGEVDIDKKDGIATITVDPIDVLYAELGNITVVKSAKATSARAPQFDDSKVEVKAVNPKADPSETTQYTFQYQEGYNYQITVDFQKRKDFTKQSSKAEVTVKYAERVYNGSPYEPKGDDITVKWEGKELKVGEDYDISYEDNINAGKGKVVITGKRYFMNTKEATFDIAQRDIKLATVKDIADQTYTGSEIKLELDITDINNDGANIITAGDYTLEFTNNVNAGKAKIAIVANKTNYKNIQDVYFNIVPKDITETAVIQPIDDQPYTGSVIKPTLVIKDGELTVTTDNYDAVYTNNINAGTATVNVTFKNNYKGTAKATFEIKDAVIERTLNLDFEGKAEWATFYSEENLTLPEGIKAFVVTGLNGNEVKTADVTFIPKNVGVLLQRTDNSKTAPFHSNTLPTSTKLDGVTPDTKLFQGTVTGISDFSTYSGNKFILVDDKFVQAIEGNLPANRCYLNTGDATIDGVSELVIGKSANDIILQEEGKENRNAGIISVSEGNGGKMIITVTPISVLYATAENITVVMSANAGSARAPEFDDSNVKVTAVDATADPSETTQYTFPYTEGYNYQITVNFQKRIDLLKASYKPFVTLETTNYVYDGTEHRPTVKSVTYVKDSKTETIGPSNYDVTYEDNKYAGTAKAVVTGKGIFMGATHANFNIAQRDIKLVTVKDIADLIYTGTEIKPELTITDINEDGVNIITEDDYTLTYEENTNVGKAKIAIIANNTNYKNIKDVFFNIVRKDITETAIIQPIEDQVYTGSAITPELTIKDGDIILTEKDYDATFSNNIEVGTATVDIEFKGNYMGSAKVTFNILDAIIERTFNLDFEGESEWATYYAAENLTLPEGIKAYIVTGFDEKGLATTEIDFIPKNVAVLLQRTGNQTAPFIGSTMPASTKLPEGVKPDTELFCGTTTGIEDLSTINGNKFVLVNDKFVQVVEGALPANHCYLNTGDKVIEGVTQLINDKSTDAIIVQEEGEENRNAGTVTLSEMKDGKITITVKPFVSLYAIDENITVIRSARAESARAPQFDLIDDSKVEVTAVDPLADPSGTTQYTFPYQEGYHYQVIVDFQKRIDLLKVATKPVVTLDISNFDYDGTEHKPNVVSLKIGEDGVEVDPSNYDITYEGNINAGTGRVVITGKRFLMGGTHATFNIAQRDINLVTVKDIPDQDYTGVPIEPTLDIIDIIEEGSESIINENDYHLEFKNNTEIGTATITIIANKINYKGEKKVTFNIVPATGIDHFTIDEQDGQWYDLNGQHINRPTQKGIYILRDKNKKMKKVRVK